MTTNHTCATYGGVRYYGTMHSAGYSIPEESFDILRKKCQDLKLTIINLFSHGTIDGKEVVGVLCTDDINGMQSLPYFRVRTRRDIKQHQTHMSVMECINKQGPTIPEEGSVMVDIMSESVTEDNCRWWIDRYYQDIADLKFYQNNLRPSILSARMLLAAYLPAVRAYLDNDPFFGYSYVQRRQRTITVWPHVFYGGGTNSPMKWLAN